MCRFVLHMSIYSVNIFSVGLATKGRNVKILKTRLIRFRDFWNIFLLFLYYLSFFSFLFFFERFATFGCFHPCFIYIYKWDYILIINLLLKISMQQNTSRAAISWLLKIFLFSVDRETLTATLGAVLTYFIILLQTIQCQSNYKKHI